LLYILSGQDDFSIAQMLEQIKDGLGDRESLEINTTVLDGQSVTLEQLSVACETVPFLTEKRLVIIEGLLARFSPRDGNNRQKKNNQDNGHKEISNCILNMPESTVLVLIDSVIKNNNPLYKELAPRVTVKNYPFLKDTKLREWVQKRVAEEGGEISPRAANLLARLVGSNLWTMSGEVNKLVLYASGRKIEEEDVKKLVGYTQQFTVFNLVDAILEFRAEAAEQLLQQQLQAGAAPVYLLTMLARQVRMIVLAKEFVGKRLKTVEMQSKLGTTSEYVVRKTIEQAGRYSLSRIKEVYRRILETDLLIKTGKLNDELALNILVAELSGRTESPATRRN
jgi:DNA polymerase-3 subunit delta